MSSDGMVHGIMTSAFVRALEKSGYSRKLTHGELAEMIEEQISEIK